MQQSNRFLTDVRELLAYNWQAEERDYEQQDDDGRANHIWLVMQRLDAAAGNLAFEIADARGGVKKWSATASHWP